MEPNEQLAKAFAEQDFITLFKSASHPREKTRFLAFSHLQNGKKPREVAELLHTTRNTIYVWIRKFLSCGIEGLKEKPGRGNKPLIPNSETEAFRQSVINLQSGRSGGVITGKDVLDLMREKYGVECSLKSAYNHLKRASLVWISARSKHPNTDLAAQEDFKKNSKKK